MASISSIKRLRCISAARVSHCCKQSISQPTRLSLYATPKGSSCSSVSSTIRQRRLLHSICHRANPSSSSPSSRNQLHAYCSITSKHDFRRSVASSTAQHDITDLAPAAIYQPPSSGLLSYLPKSFIPYAELIRLDKPAGAYYLFFPCLWSSLMAASAAVPLASPLSVLGTSALFLMGSIVMRGAGCTINDLWDRNLDPHVARTRLRPIARRAVTPEAAIAFTGAQLLTGLAVLLQFPSEVFWYATPSLAFVAMYPLAKRVTYYPQFVLGLTFSWGAMLGFPALGVDLLGSQPALTAAACLYSSNVAWTVLYDMIYAHMDIKDDAKAGIKSIALRHDKDTKAVLTGLAAVQIGLLGAAGAALGMGPAFFIGSCGGAAVTLGTMIWRVKLKDVTNCWWWFVNGCWITGGSISIGLLGEYYARLSTPTDSDEQIPA